MPLNEKHGGPSCILSPSDLAKAAPMRANHFRRDRSAISGIGGSGSPVRKCGAISDDSPVQPQDGTKTESISAPDYEPDGTHRLWAFGVVQAAALADGNLAH